jgi:hypothetical protein
VVEDKEKEKEREEGKRRIKDVHLSQVTSARMVSPIFPPELRYVTTI